MTVDEIMHNANELIRYGIRFRDCPLGFYPDFEYYYCEDHLCLVRHKKSGVMMFVSENFLPKEAIETMIDRMKKGGIYEKRRKIRKGNIKTCK